MPPSARLALIATARNDPWNAACAFGAIWMALSLSERDSVAACVLEHKGASIAMLERLGPEGFSLLTSEQRTALLSAALPIGHASALVVGSLWDGLTDEERGACAESICSPFLAARFMQRLGRHGWTLAPERARRAVIDVVLRSPDSASEALFAEWARMDDDLRGKLHAAIVAAEDAARAITRSLSVGLPWRPWMATFIADDSLVPWRKAMQQLSNEERQRVWRSVPVSVAARLIPQRQSR